MDLRSLLPRTWYALMAHHPQPRPIQLEAIPMVLEGRNVLLSSATASGKTEAYLAPLVERWLSDLSRGEQRLVIVTPTRALVNDLARRMRAPLQRCGVKVSRRTGDHPRDLSREEAGLVITTPESLDSVLCRHPRWLGATRAVVLDELHVLWGSARGDQVRVLLERLDKVVAALGQEPVQRVGATATLADPAGVARAFLGPAAVVATDDGYRELSLEVRPGGDPESLLEQVIELCRRWEARKVLAFLPSRADCEEFGAALAGRRPFGAGVLVHHGSLSRQERERVERTFLSAPCALCFATSTLELGLDIGDVDLVCLMGPPADVSSFLQRIGRGNRRSGRCQVLGIARSVAEEQRLFHLAECARAGRLLEDPRQLHRSVLIQQCFSLLFQNRNRSISPEAVAARLPQVYRQFDLQALLDRLVEREWLERSGAPTPKLEREFEKARIHHNLSSGETESRKVDVLDEVTGRVVGTVVRDQRGNLPHEMTLGGRRRRLLADRGRQAVASQVAPGGQTRFASRGTATVSRALTQDLRRFLKVPDGVMPWTRCGNLVVAGHFLGSLWSGVYRSALPSGTGSNAFVVWLKGDEGDMVVGADQLRQVLRRRPVKLAEELGLGRWVRELPREWLADELEERVDPSGLAAVLAGLRPVPAEPELAVILAGLLPEPVRMAFEE